MEHPTWLEDEYLAFLDRLRESGVTNMFGAAPFLRSAFPEIGERESRDILGYWMKTFSERRSDGN